MPHQFVYFFAHPAPVEVRTEETIQPNHNHSTVAMSSLALAERLGIKDLLDFHSITEPALASDLAKVVCKNLIKPQTTAGIYTNN